MLIRPKLYTVYSTTGSRVDSTPVPPILCHFSQTVAVVWPLFSTTWRLLSTIYRSTNCLPLEVCRTAAESASCRRLLQRSSPNCLCLLGWCSTYSSNQSLPDSPLTTVLLQTVLLRTSVTEISPLIWYNARLAGQYIWNGTQKRLKLASLTSDISWPPNRSKMNRNRRNKHPWSYKRPSPHFCRF